AAVIFTDGSFLGYSKPYDNQSDVVTYIFSRRKAEAAAWIRWQNFLKSLAGKDARTAVDEFIRAVSAIPISTTFDRITNSAEQNRADDESEGENQVLMALQGEARNAQASLRAHDAKWVLDQHLNKIVAQRAEETSRFAIRKDEK
ncbi:MAG TPA: hypothetical protein VKT81_10320, partial [Bryobacteraceae bacterium]|nr:hypothetical protein [Bryobacteraceae bacterium]